MYGACSCNSIYIHIILHPSIVCRPQGLHSAYKYKNNQILFLQDFVCLICSNSDTAHPPFGIFLRFSQHTSACPFLFYSEYAYVFYRYLQSNEPANRHPNALIAVLAAFTLTLRIPFLLVTSPKIPIPVSIRRSTTTAFQQILNKTLVWSVVFFLGLVSTLGGAGQRVCRVISDSGLIGAIVGTYLLPGKHSYPLFLN